MSKLLGIDGQKDFQKLVILLTSSKHFIIEFAQGTSHIFYLIFFQNS